MRTLETTPSSSLCWLFHILAGPLEIWAAKPPPGLILKQNTSNWEDVLTLAGPLEIRAAKPPPGLILKQNTSNWEDVLTLAGTLEIGAAKPPPSCISKDYPRKSRVANNFTGFSPANRHFVYNAFAESTSLKETRYVTSRTTYPST